MGVKLREKQLSSGQISFYLDIYHNKARWYEFLEIHINKNRPSPDDKEKKRLAQEAATFIAITYNAPAKSRCRPAAFF